MEGGERAVEKVILVLVELKRRPHAFVHEDHDEMRELVRSAGGLIQGEAIAKIDKPAPAHYIRMGKLEEIRLRRIQTGATLAIFNIDLSPVQSRNIETACGLRVVDRTGLILDIFASRAKSNEGRLQVELAQLNYMLPRLVGRGVIMSRLGGGIGTRGPGEQKLEVDRRQIRNRISRLKRDLEKLSQHRELLRKSRKRKDYTLIAIVGYTNAGKSTLLNALTGAAVLVEDKLFATLDPTTRAFEDERLGKILFTDTVGFLAKLPHHLVEAFQATLEEVTEADLLIHVVDASNPYMQDQFHTVNQILKQLGAEGKPTILVCNKVDRLSPAEEERTLQKFSEAILVGAKDRVNLPILIEKISEYVRAFKDNGRTNFAEPQEASGDE